MELYAAFFVIAVFYIAYFTKAALQSRQGVKTMILGKGNKPAEQRRIETSLKITTFIILYRVSRNPAFLGFDLIYLGILIAYPNAWHAVVVAIAIFLFHKQIKSEEIFMENAFGQDYLDYKKKVRRYL